MGGADMLLGGVDLGKKTPKPPVMPKSKIPVQNVLMTGIGGVDVLNDFNKSPANSNKLGFFKKISSVLDKIGNSKGVKALTSIGVFLGGATFALASIPFVALIAGMAGLALAGKGIFDNWQNISKKLKETIRLFKVLFEFESNGTMAKFGSGISLLIGKAIEGTIWLINRMIEGFIVMKNMLSGMNIDEAHLNMQYSLSKYDPKQQKEFDKNIAPEIKGKERQDLIDTQARLKYQQPQVNIQSFTNVVVEKDGTVTQETYSKNMNTGKTSPVQKTALPYSAMLRQGIR